MSQIIKTKQFGEVEFEKSWAVSNGKHIGKLANGRGYLHFTGQPISTLKELQEVIPPGPDLDEAVAWWRNKDKRRDDSELPDKKVVINPDGSCAFDDGSPIESVADLFNAIPRGPMLDAAVAWFTEDAKKRKFQEQVQKSHKENVAGQNVQEAKEKAIKDRGEKVPNITFA
jgi:hypothetical protein